MNELLVFTKKYLESEFNGCIITNEHICRGNDIFPVKALWDTGSSESVISSDLAEKLKLESVGMSNVSSSGSAFISKVYNIIVLIAERQKISLQVTESNQLAENDIDILIGMDVITLGDFAISSYNGEICFSYRYPSQGLIDFTK